MEQCVGEGAGIALPVCLQQEGCCNRPVIRHLKVQHTQAQLVTNTFCLTVHARWSCWPVHWLLLHPFSR